MSNIIEEYRKRNEQIRELRNKYNLGVHPHLKNPEGVKVHIKGQESESDDKNDTLSAEEAKTFQSHSPTSIRSKGLTKKSDDDGKSEIATTKSERGKIDNMFGEFEYKDILEGGFSDLDDGWISSEEEDTTEESKRLTTTNNDSMNQSSLTGEIKSEAEEGKIGEDSDSQEELKQVAPEKVNWIKYIFKKYSNGTEEENAALNSSVVIKDVLNLLLSADSDEMIQDRLLDCVGAERFDMIIELIEKRKYIVNY